MFTGIIEHVGRVVALEPGEGMLELVLEAGPVAQGASLGDSVAVNGACLTIARQEGDRLTFAAVRETLERTSTGDLEVGSLVNLERALRADGRLDGHIVQGHVDATGRVAILEHRGNDVRLVVDCEPDFTRSLVEKGSVAIEGVSLTVVNVEERRFDVVLIPHSLDRTNLGGKTPGDRVNLEADILGKYVEKQLGTYLEFLAKLERESAGREALGKEGKERRS